MAEGLGNLPKDKWPQVTTKEMATTPIQRLAPRTELHGKVLNYLKERLKHSEDEMSKFHDRWRASEIRAQAYIDRKDWEKVMEQLNDKGKTPAPLSIVVPHTFATISTITTYLIHTYAGRKPMFQVGSYKKETVQNARMQEIMLQYNADHTRLIKHLYQFLNDTMIYGVGILNTRWTDVYKQRTVWKASENVIAGVSLGGGRERTKERRLIYSGNEVVSRDPFMFFPDPTVPMAEVGSKGEFVFWREYSGKHILKTEEAEGRFKWINHIGDMPVNSASGQSQRSLISGGEPHPGHMPTGSHHWIRNNAQLDMGTVEIIPRELGLGESERPEKWLFTIANKHQIIEAKPLELDHDMHPVAVAEPFTFGYGFGQPSLSDFIGDFQDLMSWQINSHIDNVRAALNNMFVADPSRIVMKDFLEPGPGKIIRVKESAQGQDIRSMVQQLQVYDVTQGHARDFELMTRIADGIIGTNDNLRGLQDPGGRKSATEVRLSGEAGASRLASLAKIISAQAIVDLVEQMSLNIQQNLDDDFFLDVVGMQGMETHIRSLGMAEDVTIRPEMIVGDFYYPVHDGTLPLDRVALLDVWKEIFMAVAADPQLRQEFSIIEIFKHVAELGGAKNLDQFQVNLQTQPDNQVQGMDALGGAGAPPAPGQTPGVQANPGARLAGAFG